MHEEDDFLPVSALHQLAFCARRCALMYIECIWEDNPFTLEGTQLHEQAHSDDIEVRPGVRIARGLMLHSHRLGLSGKTDVVEFQYCEQPDAEAEGSHCVRLPDVEGLWRPYPVEYKRGRPRPDHTDTVQLCAQALCLEEMLHVTISTGAIYYGKPRRRQEVELDAELRAETESLAARLHQFIAAGVTPPARYEKKCQGCSLLDTCLPRTAGAGRSAAAYLSAALREPSDGGDRGQ